MPDRIDLSVIIVSHNTWKYTVECIESVVSSIQNVKVEVIVVDNHSQDASIAKISGLAKSYKKVHLYKIDENRGFAYGNNIGISKAGGRYLLFLNSDTIVPEGTLDNVISFMDEHGDIGIFSCSLKNKDGSLQGTGGYFPTLLRVFSWMTIQDLPFVDKIIKPFHPMKEKSFAKEDKFYKTPRELDWVTGAFMMVRKEVVNDVGDWDTDYFMYTEEVDYCYRASQNGWKIYYDPSWSVTHFGGGSSSKEFSVLSEFRGIKLFYKKHYPRWQTPVLRLLLKVGAAGRIVVMGLVEGRKGAQIYAKAFTQA